VIIYAVVRPNESAGTPPYMVMEYIEGGTLAQRVRKEGPLHWRDAATAMRDALRGLAAAHRAGIVHRDIKPANLMRGMGPMGEEIIKLTDFGLARVTQSTDGELTFPGAFVGSPSYSSPEQIAGAAHVDGRADLYSLAATGYALLTGQPPFIGDDPGEIMERHVRDPFPAARELAPTVPAAFEELIAKASRKSAAERHQSAEEMLRVVEAILQLPAENAARSRAARPARAAASGSSAEATIAEWRTRLAAARKASDSSTQLEALRSLYGLYAQLDRREEATRAYREAVALHVRMQDPRNN